MNLQQRRKYNEQLIGGGGNITPKMVYNELEKFHTKMKNSLNWKNVRTNAVTKTSKFEKGGTADSNSFSGQLGFVRNFSDPYACFSTLTRKPHGRSLAKLLGKYMRQKHPKFKFTSICVNRNWPGTLHVDRNNSGPSMMLTVGSPGLKGGNLYVHKLKGGSKVLKTANKIVHFDGNDAHMTFPYSGTRYSMVFYTIKRRIDPQRRKELRKLYFNVPTSVKLGVKHTPRKLRLNGAIEDMKTKYPSLYRTYQKRQAGSEKAVAAYRKSRNAFKGYPNGFPSFGKKQSSRRTRRN